MACPPSARLELQFPTTTTEYAEEGRFAHALAELKLSRAVANTIKPSVYRKRLAEMQKHPMYSQAMEEHIDYYVSQVAELFLARKKQCLDALVLLEQRLDFSTWVPEGFGTGDVVIISDGSVEIVDLKYGKGVPVSAEGNPQTRLYGLGAIATYEMLYDFSRVRMTIIQPRLENTSTEELTVEELLTWAEEELKPKAQLAFAGEGEFTAGEHCQFCRAKVTCRARAEANLELAKYEFQEPFLLSDDEIAEILGQADQLQAWVNDIKTYALEQARDHGKKWPGWKLVEGRSNRRYVDEAEVIRTLLSAGYREDEITEKSVLSITNLEKLLGKTRFNELLKGLVFKPPGAPTLVPESDKRPEWTRNQAAINEFKEE